MRCWPLNDAYCEGLTVVLAVLFFAEECVFKGVLVGFIDALP
jgi:hypothetical protein